MKNFVVLAFSVGLLGNGICFTEISMATAAEKQKTINLSSLPSEVQVIVKNALSGQTNLVRKFVEDSTSKQQTVQSQLNTLLNEKGYLKGNLVAVLIQNYLNHIKANIKQLSPAETIAGTITSDFDALPLLFKYLNKIPPEQTFPSACKNYQDQLEVTKLTGGIVRKKLGSRGFTFLLYENEKVHYFPFLSEIKDVGLIGSGAEYVVSYTPNGMVQDAWLGVDAANERKAVVCMGNPYKPLIPMNPALKSGAVKE